MLKWIIYQWRMFCRRGYSPWIESNWCKIVEILFSIIYYWCSLKLHLTDWWSVWLTVRSFWYMLPARNPLLYNCIIFYLNEELLPLLHLILFQHTSFIYQDYFEFLSVFYSISHPTQTIKGTNLLIEKKVFFFN